MIDIEGHGTQKINAAYAFGGPSEAVKTLSTFAGVPITHYVEVHFEELKDVVNELGGIQVNVPESFYSDTSGISLEAGEQTLDGDQALAFARERHATRAGDFSRAQAQRGSSRPSWRRCSRSPSPRSRVPWSPSPAA